MNLKLQVAPVNHIARAPIVKIVMIRFVGCTDFFFFAVNCQLHQNTIRYFKIVTG